MVIYLSIFIKSKTIMHNSTLRIISDIHSKIPQYLKILKKCEYSIQIGDNCFNYTYRRNIDNSKHKFFGGNHDNYDLYYDTPGNMGDFGEFELNGFKGFFVRGGFSIDKTYRTKYEAETGQKIWWKEEQLSLTKLQEMVDLYKKVKPDLMISHTCPTSVARKIGNPAILRNLGYDPDSFTTKTQEALQECFEWHKATCHFFGHFHQDVDFVLNNTRFICKPELEYIDINQNLEVVSPSKH